MDKTCKELVKNEYLSRLDDFKAFYNRLFSEDDVFSEVNEYGLSWDYVSKNTFKNQRKGYYRWQLSWGGPADEFRIYTDSDKNIIKVEYWYLDWFDGASIEINDKEVIYWIEQFLECDLSPSELDEWQVGASYRFS